MGSKWVNNPQWFGIAGGEVTLAARLLANPDVVLTNFYWVVNPALAMAIWTTGPGDWPFFNIVWLNKRSPRFPYGYDVEPPLPSVNTLSP